MTGAAIVAVAVIALGLFFLVGASAIGGEAPYAGVGPRAFPVLVGAALTLTGLAFLLGVRRGAHVAVSTAASLAPMGWILAGLLVATVLLQSLGFPAAAALLFITTARAFDSRTWTRNTLIGLLLASVVYVLFSRGLGVSLPGGFLDRL